MGGNSGRDTAWWEAIVRWALAHHEPLIAIVLGAALITAVVASRKPIVAGAESRAMEWLPKLHPKLTAVSDPPMSDKLLATTPENVRLREQLQIIRQRIAFHENVVVYFYARYFLALTTASIAGLLAAGMLLLISRNGWQNASAYVKVTFLIAGITAAYYAAFPGMFQQSQNIADNASLYVAYGNVENELLSYFATGEDSSGKAQAPGEFVHAIDRRLAGLYRIPIGFDASKVPSSVDAFNSLSK